MQSYFQRYSVNLIGVDESAFDLDYVAQAVDRLETELAGFKKCRDSKFDVRNLLKIACDYDDTFRTEVDVQNGMIARSDLPMLVANISQRILVPFGGFISVGLSLDRVEVSAGTFQPSKLEEHNYLDRVYYVLPGNLNHGQAPDAEPIRTTHLLGTNAIILDYKMIDADGKLFYQNMQRYANSGPPHLAKLKAYVFDLFRDADEYVRKVSTPVEVYHGHEHVRAEVFLALINSENENTLSSKRLKLLLNKESDGFRLIEQIESLDPINATALAISELYRCQQLGALRGFMRDAVDRSPKAALAAFYERLILGIVYLNMGHAPSGLVVSSDASIGGQALIRGLPSDQFNSFDQIVNHIQAAGKGKEARRAMQLVEDSYLQQFVGDKARERICATRGVL